jgi:glucan biosynthesis protein C
LDERVREPTTGGGVARQGELDVLRALVVVGLVLFHTAVIFGPGEFPVKAAAENRVATVLLAFGATWGMPLLFLISGMGVRHSLRSRTPGAFARERLRRLGVPLLAGLLTLVPLQAWLGQRRVGDTGSYGSFYARFWDVRPSLDFPFLVTADPDGGRFQVGHLWFLVCLLAFSLLLLPGFEWLRRPPGTRLLERLGGLLSRPGGLLLPALPIAAVELAFGSEVGRGAWNRGSYALFLLAGYLAAADPRVAGAFRRRWRPAAALGLLLFLAAGAAYAAAVGRGGPFTAMDPLGLAFRLLKSVDGWLWVVAIVGFAGARARRRPRSPAPAAPGGPGRSARLAAYANDAVLPFYLLHETVIVVVAYVVLDWPIGGVAQCCLIALVSLAATLLLYDLGVRRSPAARFLFGLKPRAVAGGSTVPPAAGRLPAHAGAPVPGGGGPDVLGEQADADDPGRDGLQGGEAAQGPQDERWPGGAAAGQQGGEEAVLDDALAPLDDHGRQDPAELDRRQVPHRRGPVAQRPGEAVGRGHGVVHGQVDADPADGGHGVGGVADAQQPRPEPAAQPVHLHP